MITTLLTALALSGSALAAPPASCMGKVGQELAICQEQRMAAQAAEIAAAKRQLEALEATCSQVCVEAPAAPAPSAPRSSGPSRIRLDVTDLQTRVGTLEGQINNGGVSDEDFDRAMAGINTRITTINSTLTDHEERLDELERKAAEPTLATPPIYVPAAPATSTPGPAGKDGKDGHPAEIGVLVGVDGIHSEEWSIVGGEVTIQVGGRLSDKLRLGGYGNGFVAGANDLGFGAGGYLGYELDWFRPSATFGWREVGLDIQTTGSRRSFQGVEVTGTLEFQPVGRWVIDVNAGAFVPNGEAAFTWGLSTGFRF